MKNRYPEYMGERLLASLDYFKTLIKVTLKIRSKINFSQTNLICEKQRQKLTDYRTADRIRAAKPVAEGSEMGAGDEDKLISDGCFRKSHYCVLYTQGLKQWEVTETIKRELPEGKGEVFYPCVELWWHGIKKTRYRPLFSGYVFIRSEMEAVKLHDMIRRNRRNILSFVRELRVEERRAAGENAFDDTESGIIDLSDEEAAFFDCLFGFTFDADLDKRREEAGEEGRFYRPPAEPDGQLSEADYAKAAAEAEVRRRRKRLPEKGVVQMSFGYRDGGKYVIMDGPLKGHEDRIVDYKPKDQKAYLDISVGGHITKVGMTILSKKVWFPKDKEALDVLDDGTEIDCKELTRIMNSGGIGRGRQ